jgi:putative DNA primase/helicase
VPADGQIKSDLAWATEILAGVIRCIGANPEAPFATEALRAAAMVEERDLTTFLRYRRNLKERHVSISALDEGLRRLKAELRAAARAPVTANSAGPRPGQGRELKLPEPQPWPTAVDGAKLLDELCATIPRYVVMAVEAVHTVALWVLFSYLLDAFETSPRLAITAPQKRCGKTTLLSLLYQLTCRPLAAANLTAAVVFRVIEAARPTLLIDETDTFVKENDELRGILNSGHSRATAFVIRCQGEDNLPRCFSTWAAIALAGIGKLPTTLADRSIEIKLKRKTNSEPAQRLDRQARAALREVARRIARWANDNRTKVNSAEPVLPDALDDRASDNWRPLIALADAAGGQWPARARAAAVALSGRRNDDGIAVAVLTAIKGLFAAQDTDRLSSRRIVAALTADPTAGWSESNRGRPLSEAQLARLLRPFEIYPTSFGNARGYRLSECQDAFARYVLPGAVDETVKVSKPAGRQALPKSRGASKAAARDGLKIHQVPRTVGRLTL